MIPLEDCKDGWLYKIDARNAGIGIFNAKDKSFTIARRKFTSTFLFDEFHWDTGAPYGTARPTEELCEAPQFSKKGEKLAWLLDKEREYEDMENEYQ